MASLGFEKSYRETVVLMTRSYLNKLSRCGAAEVLDGLNVDNNAIIGEAKANAVIGQSQQQFLVRTGAIEMGETTSHSEYSDNQPRHTLLHWIDGFARLVLKDKFSNTKSCRVNCHMHIAFKKAGAVNQLIRLLSSNDDAIQLTVTQALEALSASNMIRKYLQYASGFIILHWPKVLHGCVCLRSSTARSQWILGVDHIFAAYSPCVATLRFLGVGLVERSFSNCGQELRNPEQSLPQYYRHSCGTSLVLRNATLSCNGDYRGRWILVVGDSGDLGLEMVVGDRNLESRNETCEEWLEREDAVTYLRDFVKEPVFVSGAEQEWTSWDRTILPWHDGRDITFQKLKRALAAAFISNCGARNFRLQALEALERTNISIDSYGGCHRNHDGRVNKVETLKHYKFSLAFENSNEEDYVTENSSNPLWLELSLWLLVLQIFKILLLLLKTRKHIINQLGGRLMAHLIPSRPLWIWQLYIHLAAFAFTWPHRVERRKKKSPTLKKRPCKCTRGSETVYHIYVRERGRFEMKSIYLRSGNLTLEALKSAVLAKFTSLNHVPVWKSERPEVLKGGDELKIYRIHPAGLTQRQALYTFAFDGDVDFRGHLENNPCTKFEVIFV
ncbi:hypothetical protein KIW84_010273 [Lathyrus oleraceus]|uniref:Fucosyltransferase n=2 Tax=Pisum sativum TaxID=3888 RepID=A0A9D5B9J3_PEA|nr:hypothetical protein KIW84_010273 [Pisum sativum]